MKWFIVFSACVGLLIFTVFTVTGNNDNEIYTYDIATNEVTDKYSDDYTILQKLVFSAKRFVELGSQCFNTVATFNLSENSLLTRFVSSKFIGIILLPINFLVNIYHWVIETVNLFIMSPIVDGVSSIDFKKYIPPIM